MKYRKGFTLVETLASLCIIFIIALSVINLFGENNKIFKNISSDVEIKTNLRIAIDFLYNTLKEADNILIENDIVVDGRKIYLKKGILRYNTDSEQIAVGIDTFCVYRVKPALYKINVTSGEYTYSTYVQQRGE